MESLTWIRQQTAHDTGLTTHLFLNVPPEERSPGYVNDTEKGALLKEHIALYNTALEDHIAQFEAANSGKLILQLLLIVRLSACPSRRCQPIPSDTPSDATILTFDAHAWFNAVLDDPEQYGFDNITRYVGFLLPVLSFGQS